MTVSKPTLPPGQAETKKFPLVGEKSAPPEALDLVNWRLHVEGLVQQPLCLTLQDLMARPSRDRQVDIHCVTGWSQRAMTFSGFPLADLLREAKVLPEAHFVRFQAYSPRHHDTSLPLSLALEDTWLVHTFDGQPLTPEHGLPLRTLTPSRYFFKSLKWLHRIELLAEDQLGYWERESSYHNIGDPWPGDQRFTSGSVRPEQVEKLLQADSLKAFRGPKKILIGLDLRRWRPRDRDLRQLHLKHCDLRHADLSGVDLREANLSLCDLRFADLSHADLRGADIEGADLSGADLRHADLGLTFLSATRFFAGDLETPQFPSRTEGLRFVGASGLLEDQERFLRRQAKELALRREKDGQREET